MEGTGSAVVTPKHLFIYLLNPCSLFLINIFANERNFSTTELF